ncbi:MAG TPA: hypothetical protein VGF21_19100 [Thermoleophilaceae bacterium]|jgi:hypothetical protein
MEFIHRCHFCGWQRHAPSPTILQPHCGECGSLLDSGRPEDFASAPALTAPRLTPGIRLPSRVLTTLRYSMLGTLLVTASAGGLQAGGPWIALGAFAATGLAATPALVRE